MDYSKEFFEIQSRFARKVAEVSPQSLENTLLHYTNFYIRFGLGRDFDAANPVWQEYLKGLSQTEDAIEWTHHFYLKRQEQTISQAFQSPFGCFSYTILADNRIRLHFHNSETAEYSPLSRDRMDKRMAELAAMFAHIRQNVESPTNVVGASWLYNIESYRRLFPPTYLATAQVGHDDFAFLPLWGQFVDRHGRIKADLAERFLECLDKQQSLENVKRCFPFQVLHLECSIQEFYQFYGA